LHKYRFMPPSQVQRGQRRLEDVTAKRGSQKSPLLTDVALFMAKANVSVQAICDPSFRFLLRRAFEQGWECRAASGEQGLTMDRAGKMMIPTMDPPAINQR
jgi:DNA-binding sugar fermentation-stimulating protein